jgi:hypothetical protein
MCDVAESTSIGGAGVSGYLGFYQFRSASLVSNSALYVSTAARSASEYWPLHGMTTFGLQSFTATVQSSLNSVPQDEVIGVEHQLDKFGSTPLLGRFLLLGPSQRRRGGWIRCFCCLLRELHRL